MRITIETYKRKYIVEDEYDDHNIFEIIDMLNDLLISVGYHPNSVQEGFIQKAEEYQIGQPEKTDMPSNGEPSA